jgi:hypothetical protein
LLYAGLQLAVSQNRVVSPIKVILHFDPSKDRGIKITRRIKEVFESYRIMFKEKKEKKQQIPSQCFWKEKKKH